MITQEYTLDQVQQGYDDQAAGTIIRGVVAFDSYSRRRDGLANVSRPGGG